MLHICISDRDLCRASPLHLKRLVLRGMAVIAAAACLVTGTSCSQSARGSSRVDTNYNIGMQLVFRDLDQEILVVPPVEGGLEGWCIAMKPGECAAARAFRGPILAEGGSGHGPIVTEAADAHGTPFVRTVVILTTSGVAAVSIDGGRAIPTRAESVLPEHLRVAVVEVQGGPVAYLPSFKASLPRPLQITPLNSRGEPMAQAAGSHGSFMFAIPGRSWKRPASPPRGICEIQAIHLAGLIAQEGFVVSQINNHAGSIMAQPLLSCVSTSYSLEDSPLLAGVLLDASHPGAMPASLPATKPLLGHPGVFQALGGGFPKPLGSGGQILARRVPGAWLVVANGSGNAQRLLVLEHLRATVHL
jgi:hypothetical protein